MRGLLDKWFFVVFNTYYKDGNYSHDMPAYMVILQFSVVLGSIGFFFYAIYDLFLIYLLHGTVPVRGGPRPKASRLAVFLFTTFFIILSYLLFGYKARFQAIYALYKDEPFLRTHLAKVYAFSAMAFVFILPFLFIFFRNWYFWRRWL